MEYKIALQTDVGIKKETNQDSCCIKEAVTDRGKIVFAVLCDGMGGLEKGEVASATLVRAFSDWFEQELPELLSKDDAMQNIQYRWDRIIKEQNQNIAAYGRTLHIQLGTTVTALIIMENGDFLVGHVGDSRAYRITNNDLELLTDDQTLVAREVKQGKLTAEEAERDPRRNVLLQCVGASRIVEPKFYYGKADKEQCFMLCSDGFRHVVSDKELLEAFLPRNNCDESTMRANIKNLIELNKSRHETDNITSVLIRSF